MVGSVAAIHRYPVKSMLGEHVERGEVTGCGLDGDRAYAVLDRRGAVGSVKHPRKWGPLLECRAARSGDGAVRVRLPDGTALDAGSAELDDRLSELVGRPVTVSDKPSDAGVLERAVPAYAGGASDESRRSAVTDATGTQVTSMRVADGTFLDFGAVHAVTTGTLTTLRGRHAGDFDARRFRPNLVIDTGDAPGFPEDTWVGRRIRVGGAVLEALMPTPRCVVPTLAHGELPADPAIMRAVARDHRVPVLDIGPLTCVGIYLSVVEPGPVGRGDRVLVD